MFQIVGKISVPLYDTNKHPNLNSNLAYIQQYTLNLISSSFKNLSSNMIQKFILGLMNENFEDFENHLRDFLVEMKVFSPQDINEQERQQQLQQQLAKQKSVPGLIKDLQL
jgi:exportin-1